MPDEEFDPFAFGSGLQDDVDVAIVAGRFTTLSDYLDGTQLLWVADAIVDGEDGPETQEFRYSVGKGFEAAEKGGLAVREDGKKKPFNKSSIYARFVTAALDSGAPLRERADEHGPNRASLFDGMVFHMSQTEYDFGGEIGKRSYLMPDKFLGMKGEDKEPAKTPAKAAKAAANGEVPAKVKVALRTAAKKVVEAGGDYDDYIVAGYEVDGVMDNPEAEAFMLDDSDAGVWAKAQS